MRLNQARPPPWPYTDSMVTDDPCAEEEQDQEDYSICIGAYLTDPEDKIGHAFISVEYPKGQKTTKGFYPQDDPGDVIVEKIIDPKARILGVYGVVDDDTEYLKKPGSRIKCFSITETQAQAALARITEYEDEKPDYHLLTNQCAVFAVRVLRAAGQNIDAGFPMRPTALYETIGP